MELRRIHPFVRNALVSCVNPGMQRTGDHLADFIVLVAREVVGVMQHTDGA